MSLDTKVWERSVVALFDSIGNSVSNTIWEQTLEKPVQLQGSRAPSGSVIGQPMRGSGDAWVLCGNQDDDKAHTDDAQYR